MNELKMNILKHRIYHTLHLIPTPTTLKRLEHELQRVALSHGEDLASLQFSDIQHAVSEMSENNKILLMSDNVSLPDQRSSPVKFIPKWVTERPEFGDMPNIGF